MDNDNVQVIEYDELQAPLSLKSGQKYVIRLTDNICFIYAQLYNDSTGNSMANNAYELHGLQNDTAFSGTTDDEGILLHRSVPDDNYEVICNGYAETVEVYYLEEEEELEGKPWILRLRGLTTPVTEE